MNEKLEYLKWMLENLPKESDISLSDGKRDRWIGFIQGVLWSLDIKTIEELRNETRNNKHLQAISNCLDQILESRKQNNDFQNMSYTKLLSLITSGCKFRYISYDHKKALHEYYTSDDFAEDRKWFEKPNSWEMPDVLKEKYAIERIGKLREISFSPKGKAFKFKIGARYHKTYYLSDFGVKVFPIF